MIRKLLVGRCVGKSYYPSFCRFAELMRDDRLGRFPGVAERFDFWLMRMNELIAIADDRDRLIDPRTEQA